MRVNGSDADTVILCKHLTGCLEAIMVHDTCCSLIGFYLASSSVLFSYKYQGLLFSFLHFQLKHIVRAQSSSLTPFILLYQPSTYSLCSLDLPVINLLPPFIQKLVSVLFSTSPANTLPRNPPCHEQLTGYSMH